MGIKELYIFYFYLKADNIIIPNLSINLHNMNEVFKMIQSHLYSKYNNSIEFSSNFNMLNNQEYFLVSFQ